VFVDDGQVPRSAGGAAGLDLCPEETTGRPVEQITSPPAYHRAFRGGAARPAHRPFLDQQVQKG
jgi:hypothetical protein